MNRYYRRYNSGRGASGGNRNYGYNRGYRPQYRRRRRAWVPYAQWKARQNRGYSRGNGYRW